VVFWKVQAPAEMGSDRRLFSPGSVVTFATLGLAAAFAGCGSNGAAGTAKADGGSDGGQQFVITGDGGGDASSSTPQCIVATGQCVDTMCPGGGATSISGVVYDPAGNDPLYGIVAYVPSSPPSPITTGASCTSCNALYTGGPIAYGVTDPTGKFTISGVPDGTNVPLVIQVGKWRMQYTIPNVTKCTDNDASVLLNAKLTLPSNHTVGDIPAIAISTGAADTLECLLVRIGVDESEYGGGPSGPGRIHIFTTNNPDSGPGADTMPGAPTSSTSLWAMDSQIMPYDIVLLTCEGAETDGVEPQTLFDYAQNGGRVFASHFHYAWFTNDAADASSNPFIPENLAAWTPTAETYTTANGVIDAVIEQTLPGGGTFPRGVAMAQWLANVNALQPDGELQIEQARHNAVVSSANTQSLPWIVADQTANPAGATQYFSFDTPFGTAAAEQCGRVVYSDLHVGAASNDYGGYQTSGTGYGLIDQPAIVPTGCTKGSLSDQEKALEFMLFDLSGCVTPANQGAGGVVTLGPQ
jgi:hypothetical protein